MDPVELHRRAVAGFVEQVGRVAPDGWDAATPCPDWSARQLVNHVVAEDRWTAPLLGGATVAEVGDAFDGDLLGDDPLAALQGAAHEAVEAVTAHLAGGADPTVHLSYGDESAAEYVRQLSADHLVHGWDLAVSQGQAPVLDEGVLAEVAAWFADREELYRAAGVTGPRPDPPEPRREGSAGVLDDLLLAMGRDPRWTGGTGIG